jgi:hypothetical protein
MKNLVVVSVFLISVKFIRALQNHIQIKSPKDCIRLSSGGSALDTLPSVMSSNREHIGSCIDNAVTLVLNADYKPLSYVRIYTSSKLYYVLNISRLKHDILYRCR